MTVLCSVVLIIRYGVVFVLRCHELLLALMLLYGVQKRALLGLLQEEIPEDNQEDDDWYQQLPLDVKKC